MITTDKIKKNDRKRISRRGTHQKTTTTTKEEEIMTKNE